MAILENGKVIGKAKLISNDILKKGTAIPGRKLESIKYITLHNTGLVDVKANNFHRSLKNQNNASDGRKASWTFTVDNMEIYQEVDTTWETWHAGNSTGNKNSISIEMTMWSDKAKQEQTYINSAKLVVELMKLHNIKIENIVQHNKWSGKHCPAYLRDKKYGYDWDYFMGLVKQFINEDNKTSQNGNESVKKTYYRVIAGSYTNRTNAEAMKEQLTKYGIPSFLEVFEK